MAYTAGTPFLFVLITNYLFSFRGILLFLIKTLSLIFVGFCLKDVSYRKFGKIFRVDVLCKEHGQPVYGDQKLACDFRKEDRSALEKKIARSIVKQKEHEKKQKERAVRKKSGAR